MVRILYGLARDVKANRHGIPKRIAALTVVSEPGDTNLPGLWKVAAPLFRVIAVRARRNGLEQQLLDAYYR